MTWHIKVKLNIVENLYLKKDQIQIPNVDALSSGLNDISNDWRTKKTLFRDYLVNISNALLTCSRSVSLGNFNEPCYLLRHFERLHINVSLVMDFFLFSTSLKGIFCNLWKNLWQFFRKCQNLTFKMNFLCQDHPNHSDEGTFYFSKIIPNLWQTIY